MFTYQTYIDGKWVDSATGKTFQTFDPYTGEPWAAVPECGKVDVDRAVEAASRAVPQVTSDFGHRLAPRGSICRAYGNRPSLRSLRRSRWNSQDDRGETFTQTSSWFRLWPICDLVRCPRSCSYRGYSGHPPKGRFPSAPILNNRDRCS
jgi:hypothetical protein